MRVLDFRDHRRELNDNRHVYAVISRRARGLSIGVNLNLDKVCDFDCPYCQVDRSVAGPASGVDLAKLTHELEVVVQLIADGTLWQHAPFDTTDPALRRVADIAFSGDGEPTVAREFAEAAHLVRRLRDGSGMDCRLRLLTNATLLDRPNVKNGLDAFDELWCKLDAGTAEQFARASGSRFLFARILSNLRETAYRRPIVIQSLFFTLGGEGPSPDEVTAYVSRLREIRDAGGRIDRVQVLTVARRPADPRVEPLETNRLQSIASSVSSAGFEVETHPAPTE